MFAPSRNPTAAFPRRDVIAFLPILLLGLPSQERRPITTESPSDRTIESIAPRAEGIAEVEVIDVHEENLTASDGAAYQQVGLRILRASGATRDKICITRAVGGVDEDGESFNARFKPYGPVRVDDFKNGCRYWIAFSSQYDGQRCPQGVVAWWPDASAPTAVEEAIRADRYADQPQYDPSTGLTHGCRVDAEKGVWRVRMERDSALLWEVELPGRRFEAGMAPGDGPKFAGEWKLIERNPRSTDFQHADPSASGWYLFAEGLCRLDEANPYGLPAGDHRMTWVLDADNGKIAAIMVSRWLDRGPMSTSGVVHYLDTRTGRLRREEQYEVLERGGIAAGAEEEKWLRKLVRTFDPGTGALKSEETYRYGSTPRGNDYIPVRK